MLGRALTRDIRKKALALRLLRAAHSNLDHVPDDLINRRYIRLQPIRGFSLPPKKCLR